MNTIIDTPLSKHQKTILSNTKEEYRILFPTGEIFDIFVVNVLILCYTILARGRKPLRFCSLLESTAFFRQESEEEQGKTAQALSF